MYALSIGSLFEYLYVSILGEGSVNCFPRGKPEGSKK